MMGVSGVGGPTGTFTFRGNHYTIGQVFRGLKVFTMSHSLFFFARTEQGYLGKLVGKGINGSLLDKKVDVRLTNYEIRGIGCNEKLFLTFELHEPEPSKAQTPPIIPPPEEKPQIEIATDAALFSRGKLLNREILKYGLNDERRQAGGQWLKLAFDTVEDFTAEVKLGWTRELFGQFGLYRDIAEQYSKLRLRLGLPPAALDLPDLTKVKNVDALPPRRAKQVIDIEANAALRPAKNELANGDLNSLNRRLGESEQKLNSSLISTWLPSEIRAAKKLWQWLHYLVAGGVERFKDEYRDCAGWPQPLAEEYLKYLDQVYQQLKSALD